MRQRFRSQPYDRDEFTNNFRSMLSSTGIDISHGAVHFGDQKFNSISPEYRDYGSGHRRLQLHIPHESGRVSNLTIRRDPDRTWANVDIGTVLGSGSPLLKTSISSRTIPYPGPHHVAAMLNRHLKRVDREMDLASLDNSFKPFEDEQEDVDLLTSQHALADPDKPVYGQYGPPHPNAPDFVMGNFVKSRNWAFRSVFDKRAGGWLPPGEPEN